MPNEESRFCLGDCFDVDGVRTDTAAEFDYFGLG